MANDKIPLGGHDWNENGKYDLTDQAADYWIYKNVTEKWREEDARKQSNPPQKRTYHPSNYKEETSDDLLTELFKGLLVIAVIAGLIFLAVFVIGLLLIAFVKISA